MKDLLEEAAFKKTPIDEEQAERLIAYGKFLLSEVALCAANIPACAQ